MKSKSKNNIIKKWVNYFTQKFERTHNIVKELPFFLTRELNICFLLYKKSNQEDIWVKFKKNLKGFLNHYELELTLMEECDTREKTAKKQLRTLSLSKNVFLILLSPPKSSDKLSEIQERLLIFLPDKYTNEFETQSKFNNICENYEIIYFSIKEITENDCQIPYRILTEIRNYQLELLRIENMKSLKKKIQKVISIGIITALYEELKAMYNILENQNIYKIDIKSPNIYYVGEIPSKKGTHYITLTLAGKGNTAAAIKTTSMIYDFPTIESIIMVGIAGGVPNPNIAAEHVRLGDLVISDEEGVIQYDFGKKYPSRFIHTYSIHSPCPNLINIVKNMLKEQISSWKYYINILLDKLEKQRPDDCLDVLRKCNRRLLKKPKKIKHPYDLKRETGVPRVFLGPIATGNIVLKDEKLRDYLRDKFNVKAVEMESEGIMNTAWYFNVGYLIIRGICDYCNTDKNDIWHTYAAIIAAAFTRNLIENIPI